MNDQMLSALQNRLEDEQAAEEERDNRIAELVPAIVERLLREEKFCSDTMLDLPEAPTEYIMACAGVFAARFEIGQDDATLAQAGYDFWRYIRPYIQAEARDQAEYEAAKEVDRKIDLDRQDAEEARGEP